MSETAIQRAIAVVIGSYKAVARTLTPAERDVLRDVIAARLAADWLEEMGYLTDGDEEQAV